MKIVTDSAADLSPEEIRDLEISVAPLLIQFPDEVISSEEISRDAFYSRLVAMFPNLPTTSLPSPGVFTEIYRKLAAQGQEIISIHISSGLSNTLNAAQVGAKNLSGSLVEHVDTLTLSGGERYQVLAAALAARAGKSKDFILERLERIRESTETIYTLETLDYLARGGRIGRVQALAGSILKIKPVIFVDHKDGKYSTLSKERTIPKAMDTITGHLSQKYQRTSLWVSVMHGQAEDYAATLSEKLGQALNIAKLEVMRISPVLGVHTGPGIVGAAAVPASLMQDLE